MNTYEFEPLIDAGQAAKLLGIHPKTLQKMAREGRVPRIRVGKFWRFRRSELDSWLRTEVDSTRYAYRHTEEV